ncbi:glycosyltransferase [Helicobacter sp. MIT 14-3879]|uniref:glycosyltransferase n=1 Tax=Helicobacter sp. MIT 14-3879 TaxID=2040649 RepID=UPI0015F1514A|nr:glycosyltransferase [Helicobacter sp. MIT 14-3879]
MYLFITVKDITERGGGERVCINLVNALVEESLKTDSPLSNLHITLISFYRTRTNPFYPLMQQAQSRVSIVYLSNTQPSRNPLKKLCIKTLHRFYLSYRIHKILIKAAEDSKNEEIKLLANDGLFVPIFKVKGIDYLRLWHMRAPKKARISFKLFDSMIILSPKELLIWKKYHHDIRIIPNFLSSLPSSNILLQSHSDTHKRRILSVGSMGKGDIKGFFRLLDIAKIIADSPIYKQHVCEDWEWLIIGSGVLQEALQKKIHALDLGDFVRIEDFREDIERAYVTSDIFCLTSYSEGFAMVLLESNSWGLPAVAFDIASGPSDIIKHEKSGFLIPDNDLQSFAGKVLQLMVNKELLESMGQCARDYVRKKFSQEAIIPLWREVLR